MSKIVSEWFPPQPKTIAAPKVLTPEQLGTARWRNHQKIQKPFIPMQETFDDVEGWQVCYGQLHHIVRLLARQIPSEADRSAFLRGRETALPWGRVILHPTKVHDSYISGGSLDYNGNRIFDVRPFFMQSLQRTVADYGTNNVVDIMERAREELATVRLSADQNDWYRNSSLIGSMLRNMRIAEAIERINAPYCERSPEQLIGHNAVGYIPGPVYEYDLVSAFASRLLEFPALREFVIELDAIRRELPKSSEHLIKATLAVLPGKLLARNGSLKYRNEHLGLYIRSETRRLLEDAMELASQRGGKIYRWYIDGFYTDTDLGDYIYDLPVDGRLGNWRKKIHEHMLMGGVSLLKTDTKERTNGYLDLDWDRIREYPTRFWVTHHHVGWGDGSLKDYYKQIPVEFEGGGHHCDSFHGCHDEIHWSRDGTAQWLY